MSILHATEIVLWAAKTEKSKHLFNYKLMKSMNHDKQMKSVWRFTAPKKEEKTFGKHPTQKPLALVERCILASTQEGGFVLDPFNGGGTTGVACLRTNRCYIGIELKKDYINISKKRFDAEISHMQTLVEL